jgi:NADH-quinone oxidoreductase subunit N
MIPTPSVRWGSISPELILITTACVLFILGSFVSGRTARRFGSTVALIAFAGAGLASLILFGGADHTVMSGELHADHFANVIRMFVCAAGLLTVCSSWGMHRLDDRVTEYYALLCTAGAGMCLLAGAAGFVTLFISLELLSISLYVLCALDVRSVSSLESGFKYLVIGSVGSAFLVFGSGLVYGGAKSLQFETIGAALHNGPSHETIILFGIGMVIAGLAFKASAVPFHMWTPDVYEGAPTAITGFMATATKAVALAALLRVLVTAFDPSSSVWEGAVAAIAIASMLWGNIAALVQLNAKRMLAYSAIGQAGYLLIPVVAHTALATRALVYYLAVYVAMNLGAFAVISVREREIRRPVELDDLAGMGWTRPALGGALALFLLSLASFPPTGGFLAKLYLFSAAVQAHETYLAVVGVAATAISVAYYLRFTLALYARPEELPVRRAIPGVRMAGVSATLSAAVVIWLGIAPEPMLRWASEAARSLPL